MNSKNALAAFVAFLISHVCLAQIENIHVEIECDQKTVEVVKDKETVIPLEVEIEKEDKGLLEGTVDISVGGDKADMKSRISFREATKSVKLNKGKQSYFFYCIISKDTADFKSQKIEFTAELVIGEKKIEAKCEVTLSPASDLNYSLGDYLYDSNLTLDEVISVQSSENVLTLSGYKDDRFAKRNVILERYQVLAIREWSAVWSASHLRPLPIALVTIPFKVRPAITVDGTDFRSTSSSGLSNVGFNFELAKYQVTRYFSTARKSTHRWSIGFAATPSVEELDSKTTSGTLAADEKSKQLFISTAITIAYSYNDISFIFTPAGRDMGTSSIGKDWIYEGERWWGFGIAVSPKIFSTVLNK